MRKFQYFIILSLFLVSAKSFSLSCTSLLERIIGECTQEKCIEILYVEDIASKGACARRPVISDVPNWAQEVLANEIKGLEKFEGKKLFEVTITRRFWYPSDGDKSYEAYLRIKEEEKKYGFYGLEAKAINDSDFEQAKKYWEKKEQEEYRADLIVKIADWLIFAVSLVLLFFSVKWIRGVILKKRSRRFLLPSFLIQILLVIIGFVILGSWETFLIALHTLLVPIIWLVMLVYSIIVWVRTRGRA